MFDLTVITPTHRRPAQLANCLSQFQQQSVGHLRCEHLVVSDGIDPHARTLCEQFSARYVERSIPGGQWGSLARDRGIQEARGQYLTFWDDDNLYEPHTLATLYTAASGVDLGIVQTRYRCRTSAGHLVLPRTWSGQFIAEGDKVVERMLRSDYEVVSIVIGRSWLTQFEPLFRSSPFLDHNGPFFFREKGDGTFVVGLRIQPNTESF